MKNLTKGSRVNPPRYHGNEFPFNQLSFLEMRFGLKVEEIGEGIPGKEDVIVPVRFTNGHYGIISTTFGENKHVLVSNNPNVNRALWEAEGMPTLADGVGSDVIHVQIPGRGRARIYYNAKKYEYGYIDTFRPLETNAT